MAKAMENEEVPGEFDAPRLKYSFPPVVSYNSRGAKLIWQIFVQLVDRRGGPVAITHDMLAQPVRDLGRLRGRTAVESRQEDGKIRDTVPTFVDQGKNIGKKNATNVITQALRNALSMYNKQLKRAAGQATSSRISSGVPLGMLACVYEYPPPMLVKNEGTSDASTISDEWFAHDGHDIQKSAGTGPVWAQRKFNGVRVVAFGKGLPGGEAGGEIVLYSRTGVEYMHMDAIRESIRLLIGCAPPVPHEHPELFACGTAPAVVYLDGELYSHGKSLRWISGKARQETERDDEGGGPSSASPRDQAHGRASGPDADDGILRYYIFDCFFPVAKSNGIDVDAAFRRDYLDQMFRCYRAKALSRPGGHDGDVLVHVENFPVGSKKEIHGYLDQFVREGYEGIIVRKAWEPYVYSYNNYHSSSLVKIKPIQDDEFAVVGYKEGKGKAKGMVVWQCEVGAESVVDQHDKTFWVVPRDLTSEQRKTVFACLGEVVGPRGVTRFERDFYGKPLTVEFFERSTKTGKPTQPRATVFRTYETGEADPLTALLSECNGQGKKK